MTRKWLAAKLRALADRLDPPPVIKYVPPYLLDLHDDLIVSLALRHAREGIRA